MGVNAYRFICLFCGFRLCIPRVADFADRRRRHNGENSAIECASGMCGCEMGKGNGGRVEGSFGRLCAAKALFNCSRI